MIKTEELKEIIRTIIYTAFIKGEKPVSSIFIADKGSGKTEILKQFENIKGIKVLSDVTYLGLLELLEKDKTIKFIIIPDFLKLVMKSKSTRENILSFLNILVEEGVQSINFPQRYFNLEGRQVGLLTATTSDSFFLNQKEWDSIGFISRLLTISYSYSQQTKCEVKEYIKKRDYLKRMIIKKDILPKNKIDIYLDPELIDILLEKDIDFRRQKQLQNLVMARSIMNKRKAVNNKDIEDVIKMKKYINLLFTEV
jgi:hypothetical protein